MTIKLSRTHYLDASAIVKLFIREEGSDTLQAYFNKESDFRTTNVCFVEALMVLKRKRFYDKVPISDEEYFFACDQLLGWAHEKIEIEDIEMKDRMVFSEVEKLARKYNIDVSDAFQIVSVKRNYFSRFKSDSKPILITADGPLAKAACQEGIRVWHCVKEREPNNVGN